MGARQENRRVRQMEMAMEPPGGRVIGLSFRQDVPELTLREAAEVWRNVQNGDDRYTINHAGALVMDAHGREHPDAERAYWSDVESIVKEVLG